MFEGNLGKIVFGFSQHEVQVSEGSCYWESMVLNSLEVPGILKISLWPGNTP